MSILTEGKKEELNFTLIGAGKVGSAISLELFKREIRPVQIINRSLLKAESLAKKTSCPLFSTKVEIKSSPYFILIAVNDDSIPGVLEELGQINIPVFHCSGSTT
ncbi:MAG: NAD(P)-binding domain-containing protein, partial [Bacteroidales bacterium]|nr:NAD(P)-binding domain-containing protein [Bacteroidales bacterium]